MLESKLNTWITVNKEELEKIIDKIDGVEIENLIKHDGCKKITEEHLEDLIPLDLRIMYHFMNPENRYKENNYCIGIEMAPISTFFKCNANIDKDLVEERIEKLIDKNMLEDFAYKTICTPEGALSPKVSAQGMNLMQCILNYKK
ncbi:hypothetical protein [Clostridium perfringens]|uniref:hypothetical protein n=1 Tax=Clostridium perfringens TaxID=1502 RepID=UPI000E15BA08|nr:hypothetical protein [Clostridium perfringens]MDH5064033.1 hypothetical protein [Clostridium perfringens]UBK37501.1 hypothetical protein KLF44_13045 [Clostridium perfringens]UBK97085.1 hypothetical protein KLF49_12785 [Clostridium perfringens]SUY43060.1 Uncharacterised protein [Clostridium perfringens]